MNQMDAQQATPASPTAAAVAQSNPTQEQPVVAAAVVAPVTPARVNLDDDPNFRAYKAKMEGNLAAAQRAAAQQQAAIQQELEQLRSIAMQNLSPEEQGEFQMRQVRGELAKERQRREAIEADIARQYGLNDLSKRFDVPIDEIIGFENPGDAYERILELKTARQQTIEQRLAQIEQEIAAKSAATTPAVIAGNGVQAGSASDLQRQYDIALRARNTRDMDKILDEAAALKVPIDRTAAFSSNRQ